MHARGGLLALVLIGTVALLNSTAVAGSIWFEPTPYLSADDMPSEFKATNPFIEDFEDGTADSRLTLGPGRIIGPGFDSGIKDVTDSVDADDGSIDGDGGQAHSFWSQVWNEVGVDFETPVISAGLVFTDGEQQTEMIFEAFDTDGVSVGTHVWQTTADEVFTGTTGEDRFIGVMHDGGISRIVIQQIGRDVHGLEIDHVSFAVIPEPGSASLLMMAATILAIRCRRRR
jgi:hypothetical protein